MSVCKSTVLISTLPCPKLSQQDCSFEFAVVMPASNRRPIEREDGDLLAPPDVPKAAPIPPAQPDTVVLPKTAPAFKQPCTLKGAASALYAGMLGYFLGVVPATIKFKARQWGMIHTQGLASAQQLAVMTGMYTAVHCICQRIRMVEDGWNRGVAGCSTGAEHAAALAFDKRRHACMPAYCNGRELASYNALGRNTTAPVQQDAALVPRCSAAQAL